MNLADADYDVDLTNCDREPIHELGAVQPFGFLIAVSPDWLVKRASANVVDVFGITADELLGAPLVEYIAPETIHLLRNRLTMLRGADSVERVFGQPLRSGSDVHYDFAVHMVGNTIVLEGERSADNPISDPAGMIRAMMARLDDTGELTAFYREGARQIRAVTGFDRVMVYKFDRDGSGFVVAESAKSGIGSFLDLRYPASDIPQQARKLYLRTPFRIISDVTSTPSAIVPQRDETGAPLDLSLSVLRAVSPIHVEYLQNMGVTASLSISIIVEGRLWGLFACHHYSGARCPDFEKRSIAELFGAMFAFKLEARERKALAAYETAARATSDRLLAAVAGDATLLDRPEWLGEMLSQTVPCDGIAIWVDGKLAQSGITPPASAIPALVRRLNAMASGRVYATDHIAGVLPAAADYAETGAGVLAIPISRSPRDYVMLFRQERVRTVTWGGDPRKPAAWGPNGARLSPRRSFEAWSQEVRHRSEPFSDAEIRVAEMLRASLIEVVLRLSDDAQEERKRASERQELLIAELNHRVRNILALIRGLVRQSGRPGSTAEYIGMLEGRIEALARAHDQITQDNWSPAPLHRLIETEASAYLAGKAGRVRIDGQPVLLQPAAFSTMALVVHELMTNSAKYGALSDSGQVTVSWHTDDAGDFRMEWRERGGPAVQAPTRQGFGTTIIQRSIPYDLGGTATVRYVMSGLEADFCLPARHVVYDDRANGAAAPGPSSIVAPQGSSTADQNAPLVSGTVLLVEDSLIIAMDAEDILVSFGADRVVTAAAIQTALDEIATNDFTMAVLDVNLGTETSLPVAQMLRSRGIPFVFATGYGDQLKLTPELEHTPILQKPYTAGNLRRVIERLLLR